jgi:hypothetical protein
MFSCVGGEEYVKYCYVYYVLLMVVLITAVVGQFLKRIITYNIVVES